MNNIGLQAVLTLTQEYVSKNYAGALTDEGKKEQVKSYIENFLRDGNYKVEGFYLQTLIDRIYDEMVECSVITPYLNLPLCKSIEEININSWDDITIIYRSGKIEKLKEHFFSSQHAQDIIKRLLQKSKMIIDNTSPLAEGHLPNNIRIAAIKNPIVDDDVGIAASMRVLHPQIITKENLIETGTLLSEMMMFLETCMAHKASFLIAGETSSGKTTLLNCICAEADNLMRIYTIESGCRELFWQKRENGKVVNNVVHTVARYTDKEISNIPQERLAIMALRFHPSLIVFGEMRSSEAYEAVEASITGHTVISTIHAKTAQMAYSRTASLYLKEASVEYKQAFYKTVQAFPIVVSTSSLRDGSRKVMDISESFINSKGEVEYRSLYNFRIEKNEIVDGKYNITGSFARNNPISDNLKQILIDGGATYEIIENFSRGEK
jgi:pilus assembly protein CpaF